MIMMAISMPTTIAQDPFEAVVGIGMGAAMTAMDILSQGAAIRGDSNTEFGNIYIRCNPFCYIHHNTLLLHLILDVLGQRASDSRNIETGFGQAIQRPEPMRRRRSALRKKEDFQTTKLDAHRRMVREARPCNKGRSRPPPSTTSSPSTMAASEPVERKKRDVNEQQQMEMATDKLRQALKKMIDAAQGLAEGIRQVFKGEDSSPGDQLAVNEQAEVVDV